MTEANTQTAKPAKKEWKDMTLAERAVGCGCMGMIGIVVVVIGLGVMGAMLGSDDPAIDATERTEIASTKQTPATEPKRPSEPDTPQIQSARVIYMQSLMCSGPADILENAAGSVERGTKTLQDMAAEASITVRECKKIGNEYAQMGRYESLSAGDQEVAQSAVKAFIAMSEFEAEAAEVATQWLDGDMRPSVVQRYRDTRNSANNQRVIGMMNLRGLVEKGGTDPDLIDWLEIRP